MINELIGKIEHDGIRIFDVDSKGSIANKKLTYREDGFPGKNTFENLRVFVIFYCTYFYF